MRVCSITLVMSDSLWPHGLLPARLLCPWNSLGKNTGVICHALLQGIFPTQGSNPSLLHCRQVLYYWATREAQTEYMCPSKNSYVEILISCGMALRGGVFGRWLGHEGGAPMDEISALIKETLKNSPESFAMWGYSKKTAIYESGSSRQTPSLPAPWPWTHRLQNCEK